MESNLVLQIIPIFIVLGVFYFIVILPMKREKAQHQQMLSSLRPGDKVVTIGGIHGMVASVGENTVTLKVGGNTKIEVEKSCISKKL